MSSFENFVAKNSAVKTRKSRILCRLWQRQNGFTSGKTSDNNKTYWITKDNGKFQLREGNGVNTDLSKSPVIADLTEGEITSTKNPGELQPILRGTGMIDNEAAEILVRVNAIEDRKAQVARNNSEGKPSLLANQPDLYIQLLTYDVGSPASADRTPEPEQEIEDLPY